MFQLSIKRTEWKIQLSLRFKNNENNFHQCCGSESGLWIADPDCENQNPDPGISKIEIRTAEEGQKIKIHETDPEH